MPRVIDHVAVFGGPLEQKAVVRLCSGIRSGNAFPVQEQPGVLFGLQQVLRFCVEQDR